MMAYTNCKKIIEVGGDRVEGLAADLNELTNIKEMNWLKNKQSYGLLLRFLASILIIFRSSVGYSCIRFTRV